MKFRNALVAGALALAGLLLPAARAQEAAPRDGATVDPAPFLGKDWYGVYLQGRKVGWVEANRILETRLDVPTLVSEWRVTMKLRRGKEKIEMQLLTRGVYAAEGRQEVLELHYSKSMGATKVERVGKREADGFRIRTTQGGRETGTESVPFPRETLADIYSMEGLARAGAAVGTKRRAISFSVEEGKESEDALEVIAVEEGFADGVKSSIHVIRNTTGSKGTVITSRLSPQGKILEMELAGDMKFRLEPEELAKDIQYSGDLFVRSFLRPSKPLGPPGKVKALTLRLRGAEAGLELPSNGRQVVTKEEDGALRLVLAAGAARESLAAATEGDAKDALRSTSAYPVDHPEIQALAKAAAGDASGTEETVRRLVRFTGEYVTDAMSLASVSALDVLHDRRGDCTEHAMLLVALCRARGIPARGVHGLMYAGDGLGAFAGHQWVEVALDGRWVSVDPTWNQFPVDATHIQVDEGGKSGNVLRMMGEGMKLEVVSVETTE